MKEGEIHPPVRAGQFLPGPGGEMLPALITLNFRATNKDSIKVLFFLSSESQTPKIGHSHLSSKKA